MSTAALLLTACSQGNDVPPTDPESLIECALAGANGFTRTCVLESTAGPHGLLLTLLHADGGFRRFAVTEDGQSISAADGAQVASVIAREDGIEVAVGLDRYRIPAKAIIHARQ